MRIALDAMGSDNYPTPEIEGAVMAVQELGIEVVLCGDEAQLAPLLAQHDTGGKISIVHAPEMVAMDEKPAFASRRKANNSMARGLQLTHDGDCDGFISMGNTGAALTNGLFILKRIRGVRRPALTGQFPTRSGHVAVLDIGANADCKADYLLQFGLMGSAYARCVLGIDNPRIGLLSNGEEEGKGNQLTRDAYNLLKKSKLNFVGNVESKQLYAHEVDVVVTDGFTGNIFLKTSEAVAKLLSDTMRSGFKKSPVTMVGGLLSKSVFADVRKMLDPSEVGAAPLLGLNGLAMLGHGRSGPRAVCSALHQTKQAIETNLMETLRTEIAAQMTSKTEIQSEAT